MIANAVRRSLVQCATPGIASMLTRAVAVYIGAGALAKIVWGTPADLPLVIQGLFESNPDGGFLIVIAIELIAAIVAIAAPRTGWPFLAGLLATFVLVLTLQMTRGEHECGCFGQVITVPAWLMLLIDGAALIAIVLVQPWRSLRATPWRPWSFAVAAIAVVGAIGYLAAPVARVGAAPAAQPTETTPTTPAPDVDTTPASTWSPPARWPRFESLKPKTWIDQPINDSKLAEYVDTTVFPPNAHIIIYYETCGRCAHLLRRLAADPGDADYVMVEVPTPPNSEFPRRVNEMPPGLRIQLPSQVKWSVHTPWDILLTDGVVTHVGRGAGPAGQ